MRTEQNALTITLIGAGGKMGTRILNNLVKYDNTLLLCETAPKGIEAITASGLAVTPFEEAVPKGDLVIMAVPDKILGKVSKSVVPLMRSDATFLLLDPAAAYAQEIALRDDCTFVVAHPCHPGLFVEQDTPEAKADVFGGVAAKQDIVIALLQGKEEHFQMAEDVCKKMFAPVVKAHRITVQQMAILEPAAAEVASLAAITILREALDEAIKCGVPEEAAWAFMMGHIKIELGVYFKSTNPLSDAALIAGGYGIRKILKEDWKDIFKPESIQEVLQEMLHPKERK